MTNRNDNRNQPHTGGSKSADTEFGGELSQSKKARKKAARESFKSKLLYTSIIPKDFKRSKR